MFLDLPKLNYISPDILYRIPLLHTVVHGTIPSLPQCVSRLAQRPQSRSLTPDPSRDFSTEVKKAKNYIRVPLD